MSKIYVIENVNIYAINLCMLLRKFIAVKESHPLME